jgi:hypothetical protein
MILGMSIGAFTILHVTITLVAIGSGLIVVGGMFASHRLPVTTALFLLTTALTSITGFLFPIRGFTPALGVGLVACVVLAIALFALYKERLVGAWRWIYVITAVASLYFNVFVLVVQSFVKVSALNALAPTQSEPPFAITQAVVLAVFILMRLLPSLHSDRVPRLRHSELRCSLLAVRRCVHRHLETARFNASALP